MKQRCLLFTKPWRCLEIDKTTQIDPLLAQIDPLWSQTRGTLARLQKQNTNKMSYSLEKSKKAVSLLRVVSSPEQYVCFFNFNFGLFSYLLSFSYRFYLPYFLDLANCVSDQAEICSREGMWAIVKKYLYPVHKNKLDLRSFFLYSYPKFSTFFSIPWVVFKSVF